MNYHISSAVQNLSTFNIENLITVTLYGYAHEQVFWGEGIEFFVTSTFDVSSIVTQVTLLA